MSLSAGDRLGPYEILARIGAGGMGEVYRARDTRLNRSVAIKISSERFNERFEREAQAVAALNHPNICQLYDVGPDYLVMEFVAGHPLTTVDSPRKLLDISVQIADGLAAAHAGGFIHRDLKPDNILVTPEGRVKILDFGVSKQAGPMDPDVTEARTAAGVIVGTAAYMSPEQARGLTVDARSDQFSLGLVLHELATGQRTFQRDSSAETLSAVIRDDAAPLPGHIPAPLRWVVERCLAKEPSDRYDSTRDLYRELRQIRDRLSDTTNLATGSPTVAAPSLRRVAAPLVVGIITLMAGFAAAALWPIRVPAPPRVIPFATESDLQAMPRWSPDGGRLAYVAAAGGVLQVFTKSLDSSTPTQITQEVGSAWAPLWSPDGTRIYYLTGVRPTTRLRSIAVAGGMPQTVLEGVYKADLSPDGTTLAAIVVDGSGRYALALSSPPGAAPKPIPGISFGDVALTELRFDDAGTALGVSGGGRFWKVRLSGEPPEEIEQGADRIAGHFTWSSKHGWIISDTAVGSARPRLLLTDLGSGRTRFITTGASVDAYPTLGPDGTLAFQSGELGFDVIQVPLDGSSPTTIVATSRVETSPAWVQDGVRFVYVTDRTGTPEVWVRNQADGSESRIVSVDQFPGSDRLFDCAVSPDGRRVAYRVQGTTGPAIWISPMSGGAAAPLWNDPSRSPQRGPSWSPDGNWIAYYGEHEGRIALMKARVGGGEPAQHVANMARNFPVRWSPRGDWIAFRDSDGLRVVSPESGQQRLVSPTIWETYGWSTDGTKLIGLTYDDTRRLMLREADVDRGRERTLGDLGAVPEAFDLADSLNEFAYRGFSLHPDGKSFLTSMLKIRTQIYLMREFDRTISLWGQWFD